MSFRSSAEIGVVKIFFPSFISTIRNFVQQNLGGAFLYASLLRNMPELIGLPIVPPIEQEIGLIWKKGKYVDENHDPPAKGCNGNRLRLPSPHGDTLRTALMLARRKYRASDVPLCIPFVGETNGKSS